MKIFDTHCHPHLNQQKDQYKVIDDFFDKWWKYINLIWTNYKTINSIVEISQKYDSVFISIWIHPCDVYDLGLDEAIQFLEKIISKNKEKVIWIWETWLDYYWLEKELNEIPSSPTQEKEIENIKKTKIEKQKIFFKAQIALAKKYNLPLIIHNREAKDDVYEVLKETWCKNFIFHCFSENLDYALKIIELSPECKISFSGIVSFKNAKDIQEVAKNINIKHVLAETDAPYLTPTPLRWKEENEPYFTKYVIESINQLRWSDFSENIYNNSIEIFWIKK